MRNQRFAPGRFLPSMQAVLEKKEQDVQPYATKYACSTHQVNYYVSAGQKAVCPVCDLEADNEALRARQLKLVNELKTAQNALARLEPQVNLSTAIKQALEITETDDLTWLKVQMYQYKIDKSVSLRVTHGHPVANKKKRRSRNDAANGFLTVPRHGEPEAYLCTSIGGLALAEYLEEALTTMGSAAAMGLFLKAMWKLLPGAQQ